MSASTNLIGDITSVYNNGPNSTTQANAIAPAGKIVDYVGMTEVVLVKFKEAENLINKIITDTAAGDATNLNLLKGILDALVGTDVVGPSSHVITDTTSVYNNGPNSTTQANAIAAAGPIMDYPGNTIAIKRKFQEASNMVAVLVTDTAAGDATNLALLQGIALTLS